MRNDGSPQVIAYWLTSAWMAAHAASLIACGAAKSGKPCARLMPASPCATRILRVISRITDSAKVRESEDVGGRLIAYALGVWRTGARACPAEARFYRSR